MLFSHKIITHDQLSHFLHPEIDARTLYSNSEVIFQNSYFVGILFYEFY